MRYFAYLHNEEIGRKLCSFICEKSYEFYEFERSVPAVCDFAGCSPRSPGESGAQAAGQMEEIWKRRGEERRRRKGFYRTLCCSLAPVRILLSKTRSGKHCDKYEVFSDSNSVSKVRCYKQPLLHLAALIKTPPQKKTPAN